MKSKSILLFVVAIGCGTVAMVGVQKAMSRPGAKKEETGKVLVTTTEIAPGIPLDATNTSFRTMPLSAIPEDAVRKAEEFEARALRFRAVSGEVVLKAKLSEKGHFGVSGQIPPGMRVVTVAVDATKTHAGLLLPANRVDVVVTYKARKNDNQIVTRTRTVLENIQVFATDNRRDAATTDTDGNAAKTVSLLVTPDQGNLLMLAENKGKLHLALRGENDQSDGNAAAFDEELFDDVATGKGDPSRERLDDPHAEQPEKQDVRSFLAESQGGRQSAEAPAAGPEKPKWKVSIYSGSEIRVDEVDIPEPPAPAANIVPAAAPGGTVRDDASAAGARSLLKGLMVRFFAGV